MIGLKEFRCRSYIHNNKVKGCNIHLWDVLIDLLDEEAIPDDWRWVQDSKIGVYTDLSIERYCPVCYNTLLNKIEGGTN